MGQVTKTKGRDIFHKYGLFTTKTKGRDIFHRYGLFTIQDARKEADTRFQFDAACS